MLNITPLSGGGTVGNGRRPLAGVCVMHISLQRTMTLPLTSLALIGTRYSYPVRSKNGTPADRGFLDGVLTVYYDPSVSAAPAVVLPASPMATTLLANYPNPFNPETWIPYHLAKPADVTLTIYSVDGKIVRKLDLGHQAAGFYQSKSACGVLGVVGTVSVSALRVVCISIRLKQAISLSQRKC